MLSSIFASFQDLQSRSQSQRFQVYQLLNELMLNHRAGMCSASCQLSSANLASSA